ncbi:hypothetical protein ACO0QE_004289 [Hanseniaspora vineae]
MLKTVVSHSNILTKKFFGQSANLVLPIFKRTYIPNSEEFPTAKYEELDSFKNVELLEHCLHKNVPQYGFNEKSLVASCNDLNLTSSALSNFGVDELIRYHLVKNRLNLHEVSEKFTDATLENLFLARLKSNIPIGKQLSPMLSHLLLTPFTASEELHNLSNDFVCLSSDVEESHDFSWYSKRLGLSMAYVSSELFMAQDKSTDYVETMNFAKNRLKNWTECSSMYHNTTEFLWFQVLSGVNFIKSKTS